MNSSLILTKPGFVLGNARLLARASAAAYDAVCPQNSGSPHVVPHADQRTDTHVTFTEYDDCTVIAFRGTKDFRNWITDAQFRKQKLGKQNAEMGSVHAGFLAAVSSVLEPITKRIGAGTACPQQVLMRGEAVPAPMKPILLTGHSLGGALAVLCAWFLEMVNIPVHSVYTFGQPRVGDRVFAAAYSARLGRRTFRLVNQNDLVPRLPGVLLGYSHCGQLALVDVLGGLVLNPPLLVALASDIFGLYRAWRRFDEVLITEHFMAAYVAALDKTDIPAIKAPSTNIQAPETFQAPSSKPRAVTWMLLLGCSLELGGWNLELLFPPNQFFQII